MAMAYTNGFLSRCAERGVPEHNAVGMLKTAKAMYQEYEYPGYDEDTNRSLYGDKFGDRYAVPLPGISPVHTDPSHPTKYWYDRFSNDTDYMPTANPVRSSENGKYNTYIPSSDEYRKYGWGSYPHHGYWFDPEEYKGKAAKAIQDSKEPKEGNENSDLWYHLFDRGSNYLAEGNEEYAYPPDNVVNLYDSILPYLSEHGGFKRKFEPYVMPKQKYPDKEFPGYFYRKIPAFVTPSKPIDWEYIAGMTTGKSGRKNGNTVVVFNDPYPDDSTWAHEYGHALLQDDMSDDEKRLLNNVYPFSEGDAEASSTVVEDQLGILNDMREKLGRDPTPEEYVREVSKMNTEDLAARYNYGDTYKSRYARSLHGKYDPTESDLASAGNRPRYSDFDIAGMNDAFIRNGDRSWKNSDLEQFREKLKSIGVYDRYPELSEKHMKDMFGDFYFPPQGSPSDAPAFVEKPGPGFHWTHHLTKKETPVERYRRYRKAADENAAWRWPYDIHDAIWSEYADAVSKHRMKNDEGGYLYRRMMSDPALSEEYRRLLLGGMNQ